MNGTVCPRCKSTELSALAREGDNQRYQCAVCSENFTAPAPKGEEGHATQNPPGIAHVQIAAPEASEFVQGKCPKCGKPYQRLGLHYDRHVAACDGTPFEASVPKPRTTASAPPVPAVIPAGALKAFDLSIEALKAQRSALEAEIQGINGAIATLEKMKGLGGEPAGPFENGA